MVAEDADDAVPGAQGVEDGGIGRGKLRVVLAVAGIIIAGQDDEVGLDVLDELPRRLDELRQQVDVQVGEMQEPVPVERRGQAGQPDLVADEPRLRGIAEAPAPQADRPQAE
jgi:hypothetical protein